MAAALVSPALSAGNEPSIEDTGSSRTTIRNSIRASARDVFPSSRLASWRRDLELSATALLESLASAEQVDLMAAFALPWSFEMALHATQLTREFAETHRLADLARTIFLDAANSRTGAPSATTLAAATELAMALWSRRAERTLDVQSFVALSQTVPHFLSAAWHALLGHRDQLAVWRGLDDRSGAVDELLRFSGPSRAVFRVARADAQLGGVDVEKGRRVVLMLADANRDADVFADPNQLDLTRDASRHLAFGAGSHVCVGAPIVRLALEVATNAWVERLSDSTIIDDIQWLDGFSIRAPSHLAVISSAR